MQGLSAGAHVGVVDGGGTRAGTAQVAAFARRPVVGLEVDPERAVEAVANVVTAAERRAPLGQRMPGGRFRVSTPLRVAAFRGAALRG